MVQRIRRAVSTRNIRVRFLVGAQQVGAPTWRVTECAGSKCWPNVHVEYIRFVREWQMLTRNMNCLNLAVRENTRLAANTWFGRLHKANAYLPMLGNPASHLYLQH